jgi:hypothetical protein
MALHYTNIRFLEARLSEHNCVASFVRLDVKNEVVYRIEQTEGRKSVNLFCSDAYELGLAKYLGRPPLIGRGDIILLKPASKCAIEAWERTGEDRVLIAHMREFMGALNWSDVFKYQPKE